VLLIRGWAVGWGQARQIGRMGGLTMPVDTADQVVCTVGQTDGHSNPDHTTRRAGITWNSLGLQATLLMHDNGPMWSVLFLHSLIELAKSRL